MDGTTHSFIIKIWLVDPTLESQAVGWQGLITHVPSGECYYFDDLERIGSFMEPYLKEMGVEPDPKHMGVEPYLPRRMKCRLRKPWMTE